MKPVVAIIGRPNVGKSTLFNRLTGKRHALVADVPGVTRDRREGDAEISGFEFTLTDTAGLEEADAQSLAGRMSAQTMAGLAQADVVMLMVDGKVGILPTDTHFAEQVRVSGKKVILLVNKSEGKRGGEAVLEAYSMGLGEPVAISAEHGEGMGALYDALIEALGAQEPEAEARGAKKKRAKRKNPLLELPEEVEAVRDDIIQIAIVGRPNVGKSTFINKILGEERVLTGPEAGITRDSIAIPFQYKEHTLKLVDTAGMRKKARVVSDKLEVMAVNDTRRSIQYAQVVVLMVDATQPLEKQDNQIASMIAEEGRACVLALNKWDLIAQGDRKALLEEVEYLINKVMPHFRGLPVVTLSAERGKDVDKVMEACLRIYDIWNRRVPTGALNRWLEDALQRHTPPLVSGRRLKVKYMTQAKTRPPTFALFVNLKDGLTDAYARYLIAGLRETFDLPGVPIRILTRAGKNPYEEEDGRKS